MNLTELLGRLQAATEQELSDALNHIAASAEPLRGQPTTPETSKQVADLAAAATAIAGERTRRTELAAKASADFAAITELTAQAEPERPAEPEQPAEEPADDPADARPAAPQRPLGGQSGTEGTEGGDQLAVTTRLVPGTNDGGLGLNEDGVAHAFARMVQDTANATGRFKVVNRRWEYPEDRRLRAGSDALTNNRKVRRLQRAVRNVRAEENARVAAGLCAPLQPLYDIPTIGDTERPVRDSLTRYQADRGGITYRPALDGVTQTGGIGTWTKANDVASPIVPKTCVEISCPGVLSAEVEATYLCLTHSNMTTRFDPEFLQSVVEAQEVAHARFAENKLLTQLTNTSKDLYANRLLGASRDILTTFDKVTAYWNNVHRLSDNVALRAILPKWARNLIRADITRQMVGDGLMSLGIADAMIDDWFRVRNINPTWHLDGINPAELTTPEPDFATAAQFYALAADQSEVPGFPATVTALLFVEGTWLYLDGGEMDMGVVRDSTLNGQNRFQTFSESFEIAAFRGIESLAVHMAVEPTGQSAATVSTASATD